MEKFNDEIEFTGEFFVPGRSGDRIEADHMERYKFVCGFANRKKVLDIACGVGYPAPLFLKSGAASYLGVDINVELINYANSKYSSKLAKFVVGDICHFKGLEKYDLIACFETIEHVAEYKKALRNLYKLLDVGGELIISSPNRNITSPSSKELTNKPLNSHHTQEFTLKELVLELEEAGFYIKNNKHFGQRQRRIYTSKIMQKIQKFILSNPNEETPATVTPIKNKIPRYFLIIAQKNTVYRGVGKLENEPLVYILVLNYCSYEDTVECVKTIKCLNYVNYRLLVIDNNSPDGSGDKLKKIIPENEFVKLSINTGYAGGNNYGIELALRDKAKYVFIVNPDVRLPPKSLYEYVCTMEGDPKIGGLNPVQLSPSNGNIDQRFTNVLRNISNDEIKKNLGKKVNYEVDTLFGASLLLSRSAIEKVGGFDPLYFAYGEESDLCRRLIFFRYKLIVTCLSPVIHIRSYERHPFDLFREFLRLKGQYLYILKDINRSFIDNIKDLVYTHKAIFTKLRKEKGITFLVVYLYVKMFIWLLLHVRAILKNRNTEKRGFSHLNI